MRTQQPTPLKTQQPVCLKLSSQSICIPSGQHYSSPSPPHPCTTRSTCTSSFTAPAAHERRRSQTPQHWMYSASNIARLLHTPRALHCCTHHVQHSTSCTTVTAQICWAPTFVAPTTEKEHVSTPRDQYALFTIGITVHMLQ